MISIFNIIIISDDFKTTTSCTVTLKPTDWNPVTNQAVAKFEVLAERDFKHDHDKNLVMHFSRIQTGDAPPVFNNYEIPYLQVNSLNCMQLKDMDMVMLEQKIIHLSRHTTKPTK